MIVTLTSKRAQGIAIAVIGTMMCAMFLKHMSGTAYLLSVINLVPNTALTLLSSIIGGSTGSLPAPLQTLLPQVQATVQFLFNTLGVLAALGF